MIALLGRARGRAVIMAGVVVVLPERHALPSRDRGHTLHRDGHGQQGNR
jgi:hypothetical protein